MGSTSLQGFIQQYVCVGGGGGWDGEMQLVLRLKSQDFAIFYVDDNNSGQKN